MAIECNRRVESVNATSVRYTNEYEPQAESGTLIHEYAFLQSKGVEIPLTKLVSVDDRCDTVNALIRRIRRTSAV